MPWCASVSKKSQAPADQPSTARNSSTLTVAKRISLRRVPGASSRWSGIDNDNEAAFSNARRASRPETTGSSGNCDVHFDGAHGQW